MTHDFSDAVKATSTQLREVMGEVSPGAPDVWQPTSYMEWEAQQRTTTFLGAWSDQMRDERSLRRFCAKWIFILITIQVFAAFGVVVAQGLGWLTIDIGLLKVMVPSVLTEVFGLGFLVTKYLFSQPLRHSLDSLVRRSRSTQPVTSPTELSSDGADE
jgi:hypothetical protein